MEYSAFTTPAWYYRQHKKLCWVLGASLIILFVLFKLLFPHPNFMPDSYGYLDAARDNSPISTWPIGYSMFLRIESVFSRNDMVLVAFQYFFLQGCILYFLFGLAHLLQISRRLLAILAFIFVLNPATLLIANYVASDALFTALSLLWYCLLLQLWVHPSSRLLWVQAVLLLLLFTIRYNALYYPAVALVVLVFTRLPWKQRLKGGVLMFLLLGLFIAKNKWEYKKLTGIAQFSPFGGYMLGGNALFMYSRLPNDKEPPAAKFAALHSLVNHHMDSLRKAPKRPDSAMGVYYIWQGPLLQYTTKTYQKDTVTAFDTRWATMAPFYREYAAALIKKHPGAYMQYFMLPNAGYYFNPPSEFLNIYNQGKDSVGRSAKNWFGYKSRALKAVIRKNTITDYIAVVNTLFNIVFMGCMLGWVLLKGYKVSHIKFSRSLLLLLLLIGGNLLFSVSLAPIVFRYQLLFFVLTITFGCLLFLELAGMDKKEKASSPSALQLQAFV